MRKASSVGRDKAWNNKGGAETSTAKESDPLLPQQQQKSSVPSYSRTVVGSSNIRSRHTSGSRSPTITQHFGAAERDMNTTYAPDSQDQQEIHQSYNALQDDESPSGNYSLGEGSNSASSSHSMGSRSVHQLRRSYVARGSGEHPPLLEIPEEIYGVRKSALSVLKPLTRTWLVVSVGFALTVLFGMSRWTGMLMGLPYWFILLPSWLAHVGLFWCHLMSAKALSNFIAAANDNRQRPDSRDHLDRTEYLPLLQRSLKFGLKTGLMSFGVFIFEILVYLRFSKGRLSMAVVLLPMWIMVLGGIIDGIICKTQHFLRVICWVLLFISMVFACLKMDHDCDWVRWRMVISPIVAVLSVASGTLIYIVYGHQIGYYRLTEAQLTAGNLYSLAALISIVLLVVVGEVMPLARPVEIETRVFLILMAPLAVTLVGMGAWVVSRDEFGRLLLYGGQSAVHPRRLRWEKNGWTSVQGRGVTVIPMFGEVSFCPLEKSNESNVELCTCCTCYPYEEDEDEIVQYVDELSTHPYLVPHVASDQSAKSVSLQRQQYASDNTHRL